jgi:hypothetical protein
MTAMDYTDRQLGRIRKHLADNPASVLVIAASMGQGPIPTGFTDRDLFFLENPSQLLSRLGLKSAELGSAMYPGISLVFADKAAAREAIAPLQSVMTTDGQSLFDSAAFPCRWEGKSVTFLVNFGVESGRDTRLRYRPLGACSEATGTPADLGLAVRQRLGGGNTAYHIPEGILLACGAGISPDPSRRKVDVLDVAPSILANILNVLPARTMQGNPSLFVLDRLHSACGSSDSTNTA